MRAKPSAQNARSQSSNAAGWASMQLGVTADVLQGEIVLADGHGDGSDEALGATVIGDRPGLQPVVGGGVGRVQRLLLLVARALLGQAVVDQVPRAVVELDGEPAVQVPATALLGDHRRRQVTPALEAVLAGDHKLGVPQRDLGGGVGQDRAHPRDDGRAAAGEGAPEFLGLGAHLSQVSVVQERGGQGCAGGQGSDVHANPPSPAGSAAAGRDRDATRNHAVQEDPGALGACRGREAPWYALFLIITGPALSAWPTRN